jgi:molecular chaperone GrpE
MDDMSDVNDPRDPAPGDASEGAGTGSATEGQGGSGTPDTATMSGRDEWQRQIEEQRDKYLRLAAEYDNFRKRASRERQEAGWRAQGDLVQGIVEVLDDVMRFAHVDPTTTDAATVVQGVAMVEKKIMKSLAGHGLEVVNPVDQAFDPALHEAVSTEPALSEEEDHLVSRVYQPGYVFRGQLLRPARVVVRQWNG